MSEVSLYRLEVELDFEQRGARVTLRPRDFLEVHPLLLLLRLRPWNVVTKNR